MTYGHFVAMATRHSRLVAMVIFQCDDDAILSERCNDWRVGWTSQWKEELDGGGLGGRNRSGGRLTVTGFWNIGLPHRSWK